MESQAATPGKARGGSTRVSTVHVVCQSPLPPARVLEAAYDFSERRADVWPAVSVKHMKVHEVERTSADVTEGTRVGPIVNWERCRYDWSQPGSVVATVTNSNIYALPGSSWEIRAVPSDGGSQVEMIWVRRFKRSPRGKLFGTLFRLAGRPLFSWEARRVLRNLEKLEAAWPAG
jgi:hypothetical protein